MVAKTRAALTANPAGTLSDDGFSRIAELNGTKYWESVGSVTPASQTTQDDRLTVTESDIQALKDTNGNDISADVLASMFEIRQAERWNQDIAVDLVTRNQDTAPISIVTDFLANTAVISGGGQPDNTIILPTAFVAPPTSAGVIGDFDNVVEKEIAKTWPAETLDRRNADLWGMPVPSEDSELRLGRRYFGETTHSYTHPNPGPDDPLWIEVVNVSAATDGDPLSVEAEGDVVRADNGQSIDGPIGIPPGYFYRAFWVEATGMWHVEANRDQSLVWTTADAGKTLVQRTFTTIYQGALILR